MWDDGIVRKVWACRKDRGGSEGEATSVSADR
jgi:hypothetical protein